MQVTAFEYKIAKWYVYLLTIRMISQISVLSDVMHGAGVYFDVILHGIGLYLIIFKRRKLPSSANQAKKLFHYFASIVLLCNFSSLIMAAYTQVTIGNYAEETAFEGIMGMQIYFFQYVFMLFYNMYVFDILGGEKILAILYKLCKLLLVLGYVQIACVLNGTIRGILSSVDVFNVLQPGGDWVKVPLTGSEGASGGSLLACFVFPILFARYLTNRNKKELLLVLAFMPILLFTLSTTGYILFFACVFSFILFTNKKSRSIAFTIITSLAVLVGITVSQLDSEQQVILRYLLFEKATDQQNGSTASRSVPIYLNLGAFSESPIIGVGNGLQGYYYNKYVPSWALDVPGSDVVDFYEQAQKTIANGGVFFLGILSGYGILGTLLFALFFIRSLRLVRKNKSKMGEFYYIYTISFLPLFLCGCQGDFWGNYYIWFIISIPLFLRNDNTFVRQ